MIALLISSFFTLLGNFLCMVFYRYRYFPCVSLGPGDWKLLMHLLLSLCSDP